MIPVGYMYKSISPVPNGLGAENVVDIYSVSGCISSEFTEWIGHWKHNSYWLFDSPRIMEEISEENQPSLMDMKLFFYFAHEFEWHEPVQAWKKFAPESSFETNITLPKHSVLEGFDVVTYSCGNSAECSPLSCNDLAGEIAVNSHCLLDSFGQAKTLLESGAFNASEPGPFRILEVHGVQDD